MNYIDTVINVVSIVFLLAPIVLQVVKFISALTKNKRMEVLADRSMIIVRALQQESIDNVIKKQRACEKLAGYALEAGIPITSGQVDDYIESAVNLLKELNGNVSED